MVAKKVSLVFVASFCIFLFGLCNVLSVVRGEDQSDRAMSFVKEGLGVNATQSGKWSYAIMPSGAYKIIDGTSYASNSDNSKLSIYCEHLGDGPGLFYVTLVTDQASTELPVCAQPSMDPIERALDFLQRYETWLQDPNQTKILSTLAAADATKNNSVAIDEWALNIISNPYLTSFCWKYTINSTDYRGLGIAFVSKYVLFRDDRNLLLPPQGPPEMDLSSMSPYSPAIENPKANAQNVPLDSTIEVATSRPAALMELRLDPAVEVSNFTSETRHYSGYYTFRFAQQLKANTTYTATIIFGQYGPADLDSFPISAKSWTFTTGDSTTTSESSIPEFSSSTVLLLVLITTLSASILIKEKAKKTNITR